MDTNQKSENKIHEYREKHPKCAYCRWSDEIPFSIFTACSAKHKLIAHGAKKCTLYEPSKHV